MSTQSSPVNNGGALPSLASLLATPKSAETLMLWLFGNEGVGKSTLASQFDAPIFVAAEKGLRGFKRFPQIYPKSWVEVKQAFRVLSNDKHDRKTVILDTADWAEEMIVDYVCRRDHGTAKPDSGKPYLTVRDGKPHIDGYGFGGGWKLVQAEWRSIIPVLDALRDKGINVLFLSHASTQKSPQQEQEFDASIIAPAVNKLTTDLFSQYMDATLFLTFEMETLKEGDERNRAKMISTGERRLITQYRGAVRAKNRFSLPYKMDASYSDLMRRIEENTPENSAPLKAEMHALLDKMPASQADVVRAARAWVNDRSGHNMDALRDQLAKLRVKIAEGAAANGAQNSTATVAAAGAAS